MSQDKAFSINIRRLRDSKGWSQLELAEMAGVSNHTVFRAESKNMIPRGENIRKLAEALGVSESELFKGLESTPQPPSKPELVLALIQKLPTLDQRELSKILAFIDHRIIAKRSHPSDSSSD